MNKVITIGRQFGSGGHEVGYRLAKKLGIPFYDKEILTLTAEKSNFSEGFLAQIDEKKPSWFIPETSGGSQFYNLSSNDRAFIEKGNVMKELAAKGPCVIVGRGSDYILKDFNPVNVFISADMEDRIARKLALDETGKLSKDAAKKMIVHADKTRAKYYEFYAHKIWGDATHYDLCINTSTVGIDGAVEVIVKYLEQFHLNSILPDNL